MTGDSSGGRMSLNQRVLDVMVERIELLNAIGVALSSEKDPVRLQEQILIGSKLVSHADGGTFYEVDPEGSSLRFKIMRTDSLGVSMGGTAAPPVDLPPVRLYHDDDSPNHASVVAHAVLSERTINIPDAYDASGFDFSTVRAFDDRTGYRSRSMLTVPMKDHEGTTIGVLQLLNARAGDGRTVIPFSRPVQHMVESLASQAAIAMTRERLISGMHELFEAFVKLIATAIDEKSPHTGAHCQRVPELTMMIAEAVARHGEGPLAGFSMSDDDRRELHIAALLHDCGKIATPDWVMEKGTKLQCLYDRIDLLATRFEVLKRDAEIAELRAVAAGEDAQAARAEREEQERALDDDLAFLRRVNQGGESMDVDQVQQIEAIARRRWRAPDGSEQALLSDDEIENLSIRRGTLTAAEREVIKNHVNISISMLESLPYPKHLRRVPEFAGGHHERCDGHGYPRGLQREDMSVQARIMALADVFEALTAADRPYKQAMPLSQALRILRSMVDEGHIDRDLFEAFVRERVWERYATGFLAPEQIDDIAIEELLA